MSYKINPKLVHVEDLVAVERCVRPSHVTGEKSASICALIPSGGQHEPSRDVVLEIAFSPELRLLVKYFADSGTRHNIVDYKRPHQWRRELGGIRASRRPVLHSEASSTTETSIFGAL